MRNCSTGHRYQMASLPADGPPSEPCLASMSADELCSCLQWLCAKDLAAASDTSKVLRAAGKELWPTVLGRDLSGLALELLARSDDGSTATLPKYMRAAKLADGLTSLEHGSWHQMLPPFAARAPPAQEGHSSVLLDNRWWVVVCGFTNEGIQNTPFVCDTWALERKAPLAWSRLRTAGDTPRPKYGHTVCGIGPRQLAVVGGVRYGGYRGDVSDCHLLTLAPTSADDVAGDGVAEESASRRIPKSAEWSQIRSAAGDECTSRAYCSLTLVPARCFGSPSGVPATEMTDNVERMQTGHEDGYDAALARGPYLVCFGGIHDGDSVGALECLQLRAERARADGPRAAVDEAGGASIEPSTEQSDNQAEGDDDAAELPAARWRGRWRPLEATGMSPAARFGHSAHLHASTNRLIVVGGSNGSDLLRDGDDLYAHSDGA